LPNIVVVSTKLPIKTLAEFVAYAKAHPKELNYGSVGIGSSQHLAAAYFEQVAGIQMTHVPYRNIAQYVPDMIAGTVPVGFQWFPNVAAALQSGNAIPLAVTTGKRMTLFPNVPTVAEAGIAGYETSGWLALLAPRGTPKPIVDQLNKEMNAALADPAVRQRMAEQGAEAAGGTPDELAKFIVSETAKWREIITKGGIPVIQ
jgi:tripartite-type tricarboxylate transporter receptor subunit TctC